MQSPELLSMRDKNEFLCSFDFCSESFSILISAEQARGWQWRSVRWELPRTATLHFSRSINRCHSFFKLYKHYTREHKFTHSNTLWLPRLSGLSFYLELGIPITHPSLQGPAPPTTQSKVVNLVSLVSLVISESSMCHFNFLLSKGIADF